MKILSDKLSKMAHKYSPLGIQLLDDPEIISQIELRVKDVQSYLTQILSKWRNRQEGDVLPVQELLDAIRCPAIRNKKLAKELEDKWTQNGLCKLINSIPLINEISPTQWPLLQMVLKRQTSTEALYSCFLADRTDIKFFILCGNIHNVFLTMAGGGGGT